MIFIKFNRYPDVRSGILLLIPFCKQRQKLRALKKMTLDRCFSNEWILIQAALPPKPAFVIQCPGFCCVHAGQRAQDGPSKCLLLPKGRHQPWRLVRLQNVASRADIVKGGYGVGVGGRGEFFYLCTAFILLHLWAVQLLPVPHHQLFRGNYSAGDFAKLWLSWYFIVWYPYVLRNSLYGAFF